MKDISNSTAKKRSDDFHKCLVLLSAISIMMIELGLILSLGKIFVVIMSEFGSTRAETAAVQSTAIGVYSGAGIVNGALIHRFGPRKASLLGVCISSFGLVASFFATSTIYLILSIGICTAFGSSNLYISSVAAVGKSFAGKSSFVALSVLSAGSAFGGIIYPYVLTYLNGLYGLRGTLLITGGIKLHGVAAALLWDPPINRSNPNSTDTNISSNDVSVTNNSAANEMVESGEELIGNSSNQKTTTGIFNDIEIPDEPFRTYIITNDLQKEEIVHTTSNPPTDKRKIKDISIVKSLEGLLRHSCFVLYAIGISLTVSVINVFVIFIVDIFSDNGLSDSDSSLGLLLFNIFNIVGRLLPAIIMQKSNVSVMAAPILASIVGIAGLIVLLSLNSLEFYLTVCCLMGLTIGLLISAMSVTSLTLVGNENLPNAIGTINTLTGIGNAATGPVNGMIRDKTGSYTLVFVLATIVAVVGLVLFVIASRLQTRPKQNMKQRISI